MYKLSNNGVIRLSDNANVPNAPGNRDWRQYREWLDEGNTPEPEFTPAELLNNAKQDKRQAVRNEGLSRIQAIYPAITDIFVLDLVRDIVLSIAPAARQVHADLQAVQAVVQAAKVALSTINGLSMVEGVEAYDPVTDPNWP